MTTAVAASDSATPGSADAGSTDQPGQPAPTQHRIAELREEIDGLDHEIIRLWRERTDRSREVGTIRVASGGTRVVLAREREILNRYHRALGEEGVQLALMLLRAGRGAL